MWAKKFLIANCISNDCIKLLGGWILSNLNSMWFSGRSSTAWSSDCPHFFSPLNEAVESVDTLPIYYLDTVINKDPFRKEILICATPSFCDNFGEQNITLDPYNQFYSMLTMKPKQNKTRNAAVTGVYSNAELNIGSRLLSTKHSAATVELLGNTMTLEVPALFVKHLGKTHLGNCSKQYNLSHVVFVSPSVHLWKNTLHFNPISFLQSSVEHFGFPCEVFFFQFEVFKINRPWKQITWDDYYYMLSTLWILIFTTSKFCSDLDFFEIEKCPKNYHLQMTLLITKKLKK